MSFQKRVGLYCADRAAIATALNEVLVAAGWSLHDDISEERKVWASDGEIGRNLPMTYVEYTTDASYIYLKMWLYWNNSTHTGSVGMYNTSNIRIAHTPSQTSYIWIYANASEFFLFINRGGAARYECGVFAVEPIDPVLGILQVQVTSGSEKVLQLNSGEASQFTLNDTYQIVTVNQPTGSRRELVVVTAIDVDNDQITVDSLGGTYDAGARIGRNPFPWVVAVPSFLCSLRHQAEGSADDTTSLVGTTIIPASGYADPDSINNRWLIYPMWISEATNYGIKGIYGMPGSLRFNSALPVTCTEDTLSVGVIDSGTSSGDNDVGSLNDVSKDWEQDVFVGKAVIITGGRGAGQIRGIVANTAPSLVIDEEWATVPDDTSEYVICDEAYRALNVADNAAMSYVYLESGSNS